VLARIASLLIEAMAISPASKAILFAAGAALLYVAALHHTASAPKAFVGGWQPAVQKREVDVARRGIDIALKNRIKSVKETGRVTDAMRVVAAAKVRKAQRDTEATRPFSDELQSMIKGLAKKLKGSGLESELPMLKVNPDIKEVAMIVIGSDRGLCGPYNAFVYKRAARRVSALNELGITPKVVMVGKKGKQYAKAKLGDMKWDLVKLIEYEKGGAKKANEIGEEASNLFLSGEVGKVELIYSKFVSLLKGDPILRTILPLTPQGIEDPEDETFRLTSEDGQLKAVTEKVGKVKAKDIEADVIFDQSPEVILNSMLPLYLNSLILSALYDALACELASRMTAMKAATDNAADVGKKLLTIYNRKRQAAITAELCDIVGGCVSLESKDDGKGVGLFENEETVTDEFMNEIDGGDTPDPKMALIMRDVPADRPDKMSDEEFGQLAQVSNKLESVPAYERDM